MSIEGFPQYIRCSCGKSVEIKEDDCYEFDVELMDEVHYTRLRAWCDCGKMYTEEEILELLPDEED